jgi:bifunctional non-homologous end joining protein LigD
MMKHHSRDESAVTVKTKRSRSRPHDRRPPPATTALVGGVAVSHPQKIWWPEEGITKLDVVRYYARVAPVLLPWMADRALAAERCPEGMRGSCFFQKDFGARRGLGLPTTAIRAESTGKIVHYVVGGAKRTLLMLVNLGCIPIHLMNCRADALDQPDWLAFDLDPGSGRFADAAKVGRLVHELLEERGVRGYAKTSGGRGLHVLVPLRRGPSQAEVRAVAQSLGAAVVERAPRLATVAMNKAERRGRVFLDALRNAFGQTIAAPFSVRRRSKAPVSVPLAWDEVDPALDPAMFNIRTVERRMAERDPWADFWQHRQRLPDIEL